MNKITFSFIIWASIMIKLVYDSILIKNWFICAAALVLFILDVLVINFFWDKRVLKDKNENNK